MKTEKAPPTMDTDDLSKQTYKAILIEAELFTHDLTLQYGLLSSACKDETEYIDAAEKLTKKIMQLGERDLNNLFFGNPPDKKKLNLTLEKILTNIKEVKAIPMEKRHFDP